MFFFEKKNQKTFVSCRGLATSARLKTQKFFASFFQKRRPFFTAFGGWVSETSSINFRGAERWVALRSPNPTGFSLLLFTKLEFSKKVFFFEKRSKKLLDLPPDVSFNPEV